MRNIEFLKRARIYLLIFLGVFGSLCLPKTLQERARIAFVDAYMTLFSWETNKEQKKSEAHFLETENFLLKKELESAKDLLRASYSIKKTSPVMEEFLRPYYDKSIEAKIIFRDPTCWGSSLWINVGKNCSVQKQSPVVCGKVLLGIIDYVGERQSRVRVVSDVGMKPSVASAKSSMKSGSIQILADRLVASLESLPQSCLEDEEKANFIRLITEFSRSICCEEDGPVFRGILFGSGNPLWSNTVDVLHGDGFYCYSGDIDKERLSLGDVLVTTGMDGVFPPGLLVAEVTKIFPLKEGACTFSLEAKSLISGLERLSWVSILPPMSFNPNDRPDIFGTPWD
ncbi:rod shape-determining protein MreC [Chlamydiifrater phoenicopteri]|uniref:rod shape-determining protein MreC n=1 Tax=Chlamydiifrater phoenicopteri TaxID=2681469 RepID=UPI001BCC242E|nr:rod shape-determining protein MreC [Chlamydiifrater phoenicopteri]